MEHNVFIYVTSGKTKGATKGDSRGYLINSGLSSIISKMPAKIPIYFSLILLLSIVLPVSVVWGQSQSIKSCLMALPELKELISKNNTVLVDVRNSDDFAIIHIPESLNIKTHEIKTKAFLKGKQLVLIGYGYDTGALLDTCKSLKSSGFKSVKILENGIAGWVNENHQRVVSAVINQSVFYLQPADIPNITDIKHVLVINVTGDKSKLLDNYFVNISNVSARTSTSLFKQLKKISQSNKNQYHYMIVVDSDGQRYSALHELNQIKNGMPVMFLSGGIDDLHRYDRNRSAISNKKEFTLQNLKGCGY